MATSKTLIATFMLINLAFFAFVSSNAQCPDLSTCLTLGNSLVNAQSGSLTSTSCCQLVAGLVNTNTATCLCTNLKTTVLGSVFARTLNLAEGLPLVGGLISSLGGIPNVIPGLLISGLGNPIPGLVNGFGTLFPGLGILLPSTLNLLPGVVSSILGGLGSLPIVGSVPVNVLNKEIAALVNACGLDVTKFTCA